MANQVGSVVSQVTVKPGVSFDLKSVLGSWSGHGKRLRDDLSPANSACKFMQFLWFTGGVYYSYARSPEALPLLESKTGACDGVCGLFR